MCCFVLGLCSTVDTKRTYSMRQQKKHKEQRERERERERERRVNKQNMPKPNRVTNGKVKRLNVIEKQANLMHKSGCKGVSSETCPRAEGGTVRNILKVKPLLVNRRILSP